MLSGTREIAVSSIEQRLLVMDGYQNMAIMVKLWLHW